MYSSAHPDPLRRPPALGRASALTNDFSGQHLPVNTRLGGGGELWYSERIKGEIEEVPGVRE